jgi:uncharacterized membrane protein
MQYTPTQLKNEALSKLQNNWGNLVLATLIFIVISSAVSFIPFAGILTGGPFALGMASLYLNFTRNNNSETNQIFDGFKNFGNAIGAYILMLIIIIFFTFLLIVPGIIAGLALSQTYNVMKDNPQLGVIDCMKKSRDIMQGHKADYFILNLSFIGWALLCILTIGIGFLWLIPYINTTNAIFYNKLVTHDDLDGFAENVA